LFDAFGYVAHSSSSFCHARRRKKKLRANKASLIEIDANLITTEPISNKISVISIPQSESIPVIHSPNDSLKVSDKSVITSGKSVFSKGKMGVLEKAKVIVEKKLEEVPNGMITSEMLKKTWPELIVAAQQMEQLHLAALLQRTNPERRGDHEILIPFYHKLERETLAEQKDWMANQWKNICGVFPLFTFEERLDSESNKPNLPYTPKEKLAYLLDKNQSILSLIETLGLDIDF
jgi:hypothetical protein